MMRRHLNVCGLPTCTTSALVGNDEDHCDSFQEQLCAKVVAHGGQVFVVDEAEMTVEQLHDGACRKCFRVEQRR